MLKHNKTYQIGTYLVEIFMGIKKPTVFELGCHWAEDTKRIMNIIRNQGGFPDYHAFEPDPRNLAIIKKQKLPCFPKLSGYAISKKVGKATFTLSGGKHPVNGNIMTGANSLREPTELLKKRHAWINFDNTIEVRTITLDNYCECFDIKHIDFIWADLQGCEFDMILGGKNILKNTRYLYMEYSEDEIYKGQKSVDDCLKRLEKSGNWQVVHKWKTDILVQNLSYV